MELVGGSLEEEDSSRIPCEIRVVAAPDDHVVVAIEVAHALDRHAESIVAGVARELGICHAVQACRRAEPRGKSVHQVGSTSVGGSVVFTNGSHDQIVVAVAVHVAVACQTEASFISSIADQLAVSVTEVNTGSAVEEIGGSCVGATRVFLVSPNDEVTVAVTVEVTDELDRPAGVVTGGFSRKGEIGVGGHVLITTSRRGTVDQVHGAVVVFLVGSHDHVGDSVTRHISTGHIGSQVVTGISVEHAGAQGGIFVEGAFVNEDRPGVGAASGFSVCPNDEIVVAVVVEVTDGRGNRVVSVACAQDAVRVVVGQVCGSSRNRSEIGVDLVRTRTHNDEIVGSVVVDIAHGAAPGTEFTAAITFEGSPSRGCVSTADGTVEDEPVAGAAGGRRHQQVAVAIAIDIAQTLELFTCSEVCFGSVDDDVCVRGSVGSLQQTIVGIVVAVVVDAVEADFFCVGVDAVVRVITVRVVRGVSIRWCTVFGGVVHVTETIVVRVCEPGGVDGVVIDDVVAVVVHLVPAHFSRVRVHIGIRVVAVGVVRDRAFGHRIVAHGHGVVGISKGVVVGIGVPGGGIGTIVHDAVAVVVHTTDAVFFRIGVDGRITVVAIAVVVDVARGLIAVFQRGVRVSVSIVVEICVPGVLGAVRQRAVAVAVDVVAGVLVGVGMHRHVGVIAVAVGVHIAAGHICRAPSELHNAAEAIVVAVLIGGHHSRNLVVAVVTVDVAARELVRALRLVGDGAVTVTVTGLLPHGVSDAAGESDQSDHQGGHELVGHRCSRGRW